MYQLSVDAIICSCIVLNFPFLIGSLIGKNRIFGYRISDCVELVHLILNKIGITRSTYPFKIGDETIFPRQYSSMFSCEVISYFAHGIWVLIFQKNFYLDLPVTGSLISMPKAEKGE